MIPARALFWGLGIALALAIPARAAETVEQELRSLGRCALASSVYRSILSPAEPLVEPTEADRDLNGRMQAAEATLRRRADALAGTVSAEQAGAISVELRSQFEAQMNPGGGPRPSPRAALDLYAPLIEACIARAEILPWE